MSLQEKLQEKLEKAVEGYNEFVQMAEQERLVRLGRIQQIEEFLKEQRADDLKAESQALAEETPEAEAPEEPAED